MSLNKIVDSKIVGIGVDTIEIARFQKSIKNPRFLKKVYGEEEIKLLSQKHLESYAGNFAVKEAFVKALGVGFTKINPNDIEVLREKNNKPYIKINKKIKEALKEVDGEFIHISISHDKRSAMAFCIIERK